jgi:hypothetical protein
MVRVPSSLVIVASVAAFTVRPAGAGELCGRFLVGARPATGVTVSAVGCEAPLEKARREAHSLPAPPPLATVAAGKDGTYVLRVPVVAGKETLFAVRVEGAGVAAASLAGPWDASETVDLGDHVLLTGSALTGRVCGPTGAGVADAEVVLLAPGEPGADPDLDHAAARTRTAADGSFRLDGARPAGNVVTVEKDGFLTVRLTGVRAGSLPAPVVLGGGVPVAGSVRSVGGKAPAAGALVRFEGRVTTRWVETAADGSFAIANAPAGTVTAVADAGEGGYVEQGNIQLPLPKGKALALVLQPPSALVGRTVDAKSGRAVPRARIELWAGGKTRSVRSGADGTFAVRSLPPALWRVRADEPRYVRWTRAGVAVSAGEAKRLDIPLVLGASLAGSVTDEAGKPVADAQGVVAQSGPINLQRIVRRMRGAEPPTFRTGPDGAFKAARLVPGASQLLTITHPDFERATVGGLSLLPGATKGGVVVVLQRGSTVTGAVKDGQGHPVAGAEVTLAQSLVFGGGRAGRGGGPAFAALAGGAGPDRKTDTTGNDGAFAVRGVAPGAYVLTVTRSGYATERIDPVKVATSGPPPPFIVTLGPGASISGRVVRGSGAGAEGFVVAATVPGAPRFGGGVGTDQPTGADGGFSIDGLKPGQGYDLQLFGPAGIGQVKRGVMAPAPSVVLTVAGPGRITGTAREAQDGHPLTDFLVSYEADRGGGLRGVMRGAAGGAGGAAAGGPGQPVEINSGDGTFAIEDVPAGTWSVVVQAKGYQRAHTGGVAVEEGATTAGVEVRAAKGVTLKGHVVDALTGAAVANATASVAAAGSAPGSGAASAAASDGDATTDADGRFELAGVATGKQTLHVTQPDYTDASQTVEIAGDDTTVEVRMTQGGVLAGSVVSDAGGPVPGATVALAESGGGGGFGFGPGPGAQQAMSDGAGQFRFDHLGAGRYTVSATLGSTTSAPAEVVLQAGQSQQGVTLQLQTGVTIQGTVSGLPATMVNGMTVTAAGADSYTGSMRVGADGGFEFDNVPVGVVTLRGTATDPSGSTRSATKQVTATADQPILPVELAFDPGYTLSGQVSQAGQPVAGANVFAGLLGGGGRQATAVTDDAGSYQLTGLQQGTYTVAAISAAAGTSQRQTVTLTADQTLDIEFPSAKIAGQVVDSDGNLPLANATVTATAQDPNAAPGARQRPVSTDSNGQFSLAGLDEGSYTLATSLPDYQLDTRDVTASDQGTDGLVIALKRGAGIGIKAVDGIAGVPLPGVLVRVFGPGMTPLFGPSAITLDGDGMGEIPSLPPGTYTVFAAASGYAPVRLDGVNVPSPVVTIALTPGGTVLLQAGPKTLAAGTATGTVAASSGQPALLSLFNLQGNVAISEPNVQLRNVPPGSYVLALPAVQVSQAFTAVEGNATVVALP